LSINDSDVCSSVRGANSDCEKKLLVV
jgi:hypothetical protein